MTNLTYSKFHIGQLFSDLYAHQFQSLSHGGIAIRITHSRS